MKTKIAISWSGGKDSAFALYTLLQSEQYEIVCLLTTVTEGFERVSIHGVRERLLDQQAASIGIPVQKVYIPQQCTNDLYEQKMLEKLNELKNDFKIEGLMFGDLFLEDIKRYREKLVSKVGLLTVFPLWKYPTEQLIHDFIASDFKAVTTCIDTEQLNDSFLGIVIDKSFINQLPEHVDVCGENGEFHTFVYEGPIFNKPLGITIGEKVDRGRFHFCDLL